MGGVHRRLSDAGGVRGRIARRRPPPVAGTRLSPTGEEPARRCGGDRRAARRRGARRSRVACWRCPASVRTPRERSSRSRTNATSRSSTRTSPECWPGRPAPGSPPEQAQAAADELVPRDEGWAWNQILMDLGAVVCRPTPDCGELPARARRAAGRAPADRHPTRRRLGRGEHDAQSKFEGSDRQARGRVLATLVEGSARTDDFDGASWTASSPTASSPSPRRSRLPPLTTRSAPVVRPSPSTAGKLPCRRSCWSGSRWSRTVAADAPTEGLLPTARRRSPRTAP